MIEWNKDMAEALRELSEKLDDGTPANCELDSFVLAAVAAYREIVRLEARFEAVREAAQCPPDTDLKRRAQMLAAAWIEYNRMAR